MHFPAGGDRGELLEVEGLLWVEAVDREADTEVMQGLPGGGFFVGERLVPFAVSGVQVERIYAQHRSLSGSISLS